MNQVDKLVGYSLCQEWFLWFWHCNLVNILECTRGIGICQCIILDQCRLYNTMNNYIIYTVIVGSAHGKFVY